MDSNKPLECEIPGSTIFLVNYGLTRSTTDPCVYFHRQEEEFIIVVIFVDDGLICTNKKEKLPDILEQLSREFEMRTLSADRFLGLDLSRDRNQRLLFAQQPQFIANVLAKFGMSQCHPRNTPSDPNSRLNASMSPQNEKATHKLPR